MQSSMVKVFSILLRYFQDTIRNSIKLCTQCDGSTLLQLLLAGRSTSGQVFLYLWEWWVNLLAAASSMWVDLGTGTAATRGMVGQPYYSYS